MKAKGHWKQVTNIKVTAFDLEGKVIDVQEIKNLITTLGLNMIRDALHSVGDIADCEIKYVEVGTGGTAPTLADTSLETLLFRKIMTSTSKPADGQTRCTVYIAPAEAVGALEEIGWWAGDGAIAGDATGIFISRALYSRNKSAVESLQIERTDTITEA